MSRPQEYTREQVIEAIDRARGKVSLVAHILGCTTDTVYNYAKRYKTVEHALEAARQHFITGLVDKAEIKLEDAVMEGRPWAVRYALSTQGKTRGYVERQEHEHSGQGGGPIQILDVTKLTDEQLKRIADGENPASVLAPAGDS